MNLKKGDSLVYELLTLYKWSHGFCYYLLDLSKERLFCSVITSTLCRSCLHGELYCPKLYLPLLSVVKFICFGGSFLEGVVQESHASCLPRKK